jgi:hypothetical protein
LVLLDAEDAKEVAEGGEEAAVVWDGGGAVWCEAAAQREAAWREPLRG